MMADLDFKGKRVLVFEDRHWIAAELAHHLRVANATVLGPCATVAEATRKAPFSELAVLAVDLGDRMVFPLADILNARAVPYVFFTDSLNPVLPERFANVDRITKLASPRMVVERLNIRCHAMDGLSAVDLVPKLRLMAREHISDHRAADRLVEMALRRAIADLAPMPTGADVEVWLFRIMKGLMREGRGRFLN